MKKYYLHNGTENIGPFDIEELKSRSITKNTQVWCEGMEDWKNANEIEELKTILAVVPPPISKKVVSNSPPIVKPKTNWFRWFGKMLLITFLIVITIGVVSSYFDSKNNVPTYEESVMTIAQIEASEPANYLSADETYHPNFLGDKLKIDGVIHNTATITTFKDVVIEVIFYSKTNSEIGREQYTIYDYFVPSSKKGFKLNVKNYSNIDSIGWNVVNAVAK
jgi:hypothetical protein